MILTLKSVLLIRGTGALSSFRKSAGERTQRGLIWERGVVELRQDSGAS